MQSTNLWRATAIGCSANTSRACCRILNIAQSSWMSRRKESKGIGQEGNRVKGEGGKGE